MLQIQLKKLREREKISQYKLAADIGVAQSTVGMWENGKNKPDVDTLQKIADYFDVTVDYLLGREVDAKESEHAAPDEEEIRFALFGGAKGITPEMYAEVKQFAEMVKLREEERKRREKNQE